MVREEAIKLLRGGPDGVAEWNRRRETEEKLPEFSCVDLHGADVSGALRIQQRTVASHVLGAGIGMIDATSRQSRGTNSLKERVDARTARANDRATQDGTELKDALRNSTDDWNGGVFEKPL